jgi:hypothetical protein
MLTVQCLIIFSEPLDAMGFETVSEAVQLLFFAITFIVYLIVRGPIATSLAISALIADLAGYALEGLCTSVRHGKSCVQNRNTAVGSPSISRGAG